MAGLIWDRIPVVDNQGSWLWDEFGIRTGTHVAVVSKDRNGRGWVLMMHERMGLGFKGHAIHVTPSTNGTLFWDTPEQARKAAEDVITSHIARV